MVSVAFAHGQAFAEQGAKGGAREAAFGQVGGSVDQQRVHQFGCADKDDRGGAAVILPDGAALRGDVGQEAQVVAVDGSLFGVADGGDVLRDGVTGKRTAAGHGAPPVSVASCSCCL